MGVNLIKYISLLIGIILSSIGLFFFILYLNLLVMGYSFFIFGNFIIRRVECYFLIIGIILIYVSVERIKKR